jgi:hypothetical protein
MPSHVLSTSKGRTQRWWATWVALTPTQIQACMRLAWHASRQLWSGCVRTMLLQPSESCVTTNMFSRSCYVSDTS